MSFPVIWTLDKEKNSIDFIGNKEKITVKQDDLKRAYKEFLIWRKNIFATNFSSELFRLMCHADFINAGKILKGFPEESVVYSMWYHSINPEAFTEEMNKLLK